MIRAIIDTNVIVSGLMVPSGYEALILLAIRQGLLRPCFSQQILDEYAGVLTRPKFDFPPDEIDTLLKMLRSQGELFEPKRSPLASPDPRDSKFHDCAHTARADFIVTGNKRHFPDAPYGLTQVVNAGDLLDRITLEQGSKEHELPCHHNLEKYLDEYIAAAGIGGNPEGPLFRTADGKTGTLTGNPMWNADAYRMIQRRAKAAGLKTRIGCHTFRATGITADLKNKGTLEHTQHLANHESPRTTKLYDRRNEEISLDEVEKISI